MHLSLIVISVLLVEAVHFPPQHNKNNYAEEFSIKMAKLQISILESCAAVIQFIKEVIQYIPVYKPRT